MKKRIFSIIIAVISVMSLTACSLFDEAAEDPFASNAPVDPSKPALSGHGITDNDTDNTVVVVDGTDDNEQDAPAVEEGNGKLTDSDGSASGTFKTKDLKGNEVTQEIFTHSKVNFVNIWGTFCGPCLSEMPDLGELASEYETDQVQFIGVVCDVTDYSDASYAQKYVDDTGADTYIHLIANDSMGKWKLNNVEYVPTTLIIDCDGNVLEEIVGSKSKVEWKTLIDFYVNK